MHTGSLTTKFESPIPNEDDDVEEEFLVARKTIRFSTHLPPTVINNTGIEGLISVKSVEVLRLDPATQVVSRIKLEKVQETIEENQVMQEDNAFKSWPPPALVPYRLMLLILAIIILPCQSLSLTQPL